MIDGIQSVIAFLRRPKKIAHVLMRFVSPKTVKKALKDVDGVDALLIARVAELEGFSESALLNQVARELKLSAVETLLCPSSSAIAEFGMSIAELKYYRCLPQDEQNGTRVLAISDLSILEVDSERIKGYQLALVLDAELTRLYRHLDVTSGGNQEDEFTLEQIQAIITQLAVDASHFGAKEVLIGLPTADQYEFLAKEQSYSGKLHPQICQRLVTWLTGKRNVRIKPVCNNFHTLRLSLPNDGRERVVFLTWNVEEPVQREQPQPIELSKAAVDDEISGQILLVEDDQRYAKFLQGMLERNGYRVTHFCDANVAFQALDELKPQLIISDLHLPTVSGLEFTKRVRENKLNIPILVLTSDERILLEAELIDLGADAFIRKDEDVRIILSWCKNLCRRFDPGVKFRSANDSWTVH